MKIFQACMLYRELNKTPTAFDMLCSDNYAQYEMDTNKYNITIKAFFDTKPAKYILSAWNRKSGNTIHSMGLMASMLFSHIEKQSTKWR